MLHVAQHKWRGDGVRLASASSGHDDRSLRTDILRQELRFVEVHTLCVLLRLDVPKESVNFVVHTELIICHPELRDIQRWCQFF